MRDQVALPLRAPHLFERCGLRPPRGLLLHGPPGSGKTVLARAAAADAGATLLVLNGPDVMSEFAGAPVLERPQGVREADASLPRGPAAPAPTRAPA